MNSAVVCCTYQYGLETLQVTSLKKTLVSSPYSDLLVMISKGHKTLLQKSSST